MKHLFMLLFCFYTAFGASAQTDFRRVASFPSALNEISGMCMLDGRIWAIADGGNPSTIFRIDTMGSILSEIKCDLPNIDWEEITTDNHYLMFIGDFGNNDNNRRDLCILKGDIREIKNDSILFEKINFSFSDQVAFPPASSNLHFDCEAMVWLDDTLHIFTKNRTSPFDGWIKHYLLATQPGTQIAMLSDSFKVSGFLKELYWVTGAALNNDKNKLALISSDKVYLFSEFDRSNFFGGKFEQIALNDISQKEAIFFDNEDNLWISDEANTNPAGLYKLSFTQSTGGFYHLLNNQNITDVQLDGDYLTFNCLCPLTTIQITDQRGRTILKSTATADEKQRFNLYPISKGTYYLYYNCEKVRYSAKFIKF